MEKVYLISRCIKIKKTYCIFDYKGSHMGERFSEMHLKINNVIKDSNYLVEINVLSVYRERIYGKVINLKKII